MMQLLLATAATGAATEPSGTYLLIGMGLVAATIIIAVLELVLPSGGLLSIVGGICAVGSVICFFNYDTTLGIASIIAYLVLGPIAIIGGVKFWMNSPMADMMVLGGREAIRDDGDSDGQPHVEDKNAALRALIGAEGEAATMLRPVGVVVIEGRRINALAEAGAIETGTRVIVSDVYDNQIKVRAAQ